MPIVRFEEKTRDHALRLGVTLTFVERRRRVLAAYLEGRRLPVNTPKAIEDDSASDIMRTLAVSRCERQEENADQGTEPIIHLIPADMPVTADLLAGRKRCQRQHPRLISMAKSCPERLRLPYGYRRAPDGTIMPDPDEADAIRVAFDLLIDLSATASSPSWRLVADQLHARGYRRRHRERWRGQDVRTLTRTTIYAGYVRCNKYGIGDDIRPYAAITQPIISLAVFVRASELGYGKGEPWLHRMKALIGNESICPAMDPKLPIP